MYVEVCSRKLLLLPQEDAWPFSHIGQLAIKARLGWNAFLESANISVVFRFRGLAKISIARKMSGKTCNKDSGPHGAGHKHSSLCVLVVSMFVT